MSKLVGELFIPEKRKDALEQIFVPEVQKTKIEAKVSKEELDLAKKVLTPNTTKDELGSFFDHEQTVTKTCTGIHAIDAMLSYGIKPKICFATDMPIGMEYINGKKEVYAVKTRRGTIEECKKTLDGKIVFLYMFVKESTWCPGREDKGLFILRCHIVKENDG